MPQPIRFTNPKNGRQVEMTAYSENDLTEMAQVTADDVHSAQAYWRRYLPRRFRTLLDAVSTARSPMHY